MPIPADIVRNKLQKKLRGMSEEDKVRLLKETLEELPGYTSGPYGRLKNWIKKQMEGARRKSRSVHRKSFMVKKEGDCTIALVGAPNSGKSSLVHSLTGRKIKIGNYPFTTLKPVAGMLEVASAKLQLVEVPGLLKGAAEGHGDGKAFLSAARAADVVVLVGELTSYGFEQFLSVCSEVQKADIDFAPLVVGNKSDMTEAKNIARRLRSALSDEELVCVSANDRKSLDELKWKLWSICDLIRVYPKVSGKDEGSDPVILKRGSSVLDFAENIHREIAREVHGACVWGPSAKFDGQRVSPEHILEDKDSVQLKR